MIIGLHHLTTVKEGVVGEGRAFGSIAEAILAFDQKHARPATPRCASACPGSPSPRAKRPRASTREATVLLDDHRSAARSSTRRCRRTTRTSRAVADKGKLSAIVNDLAERYPKVEVAATLDRIKDAGFHWATRSGVTVALSDILTPPNKRQIIAGYEKQAAKVQTQFEKGLTTDAERRQELIEIWTKATDEVARAMRRQHARRTTTSTAW